MATIGESRNQESSMPGRRPSFSKSFGQSVRAALGKKEGFYYELEFLTDTSTHRIGEKKQILVDYIEIGRSSRCMVRYKGEGSEDKVSGTHVSITRNGGEWTLEHLSKTNSTVINGGDRIIRPDDSFKKYVLQNGDTIQFAKGGPVVRFIIPKENSLQNLRSNSRGTTFFNNIVGQALAPHLRTIKILIGIIITMAILWAAYAVWEHYRHEKKVAMLIETIENNKLEGIMVSDSLRAGIEAQRQKMDEMRHQISNVENVNVPEIDELIQRQGVAKDVFFIVGKAVCIMDGEEKEIPDYTYENGQLNISPYCWTGTGFLIDDGRFVTARHVIEPWWYTSCLDTTTISRIARKTLTNDEIKIKSYIIATSVVSQRQMTFTSDQFKIDRSLDQIGTIGTYEDGSDIVWRFVVPEIDGMDETMYAKDWAWAESEERGSLKADPQLSVSLRNQQPLLVMGFPHGLGSQSENGPISYQLTAIQNGLADNGCIFHSIGTDHGNSGGPIFAVKNGKLVVVGIVSCGEPKDPTKLAFLYNYAVPIKQIGSR